MAIESPGTDSYVSHKCDFAAFSCAVPSVEHFRRKFLLLFDEFSTDIRKIANP